MDKELIDYLEQRFAESETKLEQRFAESETKLGQRFAESETKLEQRFAESETKLGQRFAESDADSDRRTRELMVLVEDLRSQIQLVAEGVTGQHQRLDRFREEVAAEFGEVKALIRLSYAELEHRLKGLELKVGDLDGRLTALEAA